MVQIALTVLVFAALISAVYGQKTAQSFVRFCVGVLFALVAVITIFLYKLDQLGKSPTPQTAAPMEVASPTAASAPPAGQAQPPTRQYIVCATCGGMGLVDCPHCHGTGNEAMPILAPGETPPAPQNCPTCGGMGHITCAACGGQGGFWQ